MQKGHRLEHCEECISMPCGGNQNEGENVDVSSPDSGIFQHVTTATWTCMFDPARYTPLVILAGSWLPAIVVSKLQPQIRSDSSN